MRELNLREIQKAELSVLVKFDEICQNNNFKYYLCWGTLLGAARHKGFIPWDDDIDVMMPRKDFERFCRWIINNPQDNYSLCSRAFTKNYVYGIPRFSDMRYKYISKQTNMKNIGIGAFIDIYPIDYYGSSLEYAKKLTKKVHRMNNLYFCYINPFPDDTKKWKWILRGLVYSYLHIFKGKKYRNRQTMCIYQ